MVRKIWCVKEVRNRNCVLGAYFMCHTIGNENY